MGSAEAPPTPIRSVLLVGFMGSGKTTVGRRVADLLGWSFIDFDEAVERRAGLSVASLFRERGEPAFRALEGEVGLEALSAPWRVLATGGGWAAQPGRVESLPRDVLSVWLRVGPEAVLERVRRDGGRSRPLLETEDPAVRVRELLQRRLPFYRRARLHLDTDRVSPERVAREIVQYVRETPPAAEAGTSGKR